METKILFERTHLFCPDITVAVTAVIRGGADSGELRRAIGEAAQSNGALCSRIRLAENGDAYYAGMERPQFTVTETSARWQEVLREQEKVPFDLENGELVRFFLMKEENGLRLLILLHHLAGDGLSAVYLLEDVMTALSGGELAIKPLRIFAESDFPEGSGLNPVLRLMIKSQNRRWEKTGRAFSFEDFRRLHRRLWERRRTLVISDRLDEESTGRLASAAKARGVTVNSALTAALIEAAGERSDVGLAASLREPGNRGMANLATGISVQYTYNEGKTFWENAAEVERRIYRKLNSNKARYFLLHFMGALSPTLIDAAYFAAFDGYENGTARAMQRMLGYAGNPKGISLTNLTKLPISSRYGALALTDFLFIPPLVPNGRRVVGAASLDGRLSVSMHVSDDENTAGEEAFFRRFMERIRRLGD